MAGYLAKYATKDPNSLREPGVPRPHLTRLTTTCGGLADRARRHDADESPYLLLGKWAHMLGFRGHFSTKSRRYSVTLGKLGARHRFRQLAAETRRTGEPLDVRDLEERLLADEEETTLVIGDWTYQGSGWTRAGDQALALATNGRAREYAVARRAEQQDGMKYSGERDRVMDAATKLLNIGEVAERLRVKVVTVRWLRQEGRFAPAIKAGRRLVWDVRDVEAWIEEHREGAA